jgi:hypothetical protein
MSCSDSPATANENPRRQFLGELAAGAAALAAVACAPAATAANAPAQAPTPANQPAATPMTKSLPPQSSIIWDSSWMDKISARHKVVFDSPQIEEGTALYHAMSYLGSVKDVFGTGDSDASVVVVLRHAAVPMLYSDEMWKKYDIGTETKTLDEKTKIAVTRNIFWQNLDKDGNPSTSDKPSPTIKSLASRGVIFVGCDVATRGFSYRLARKAKMEQADVYEELKQNLLGNATLMPTGIFGMLMAQEKGCSLMRST